MALVVALVRRRGGCGLRVSGFGFRSQVLQGLLYSLEFRVLRFEVSGLCYGLGCRLGAYDRDFLDGFVFRFSSLRASHADGMMPRSST